jgi:hypothetical protein
VGPTWTHRRMVRVPSATSRGTCPLSGPGREATGLAPAAGVGSDSPDRGAVNDGVAKPVPRTSTLRRSAVTGCSTPARSLARA